MSYFQIPLGDKDFLAEMSMDGVAGYESFIVSAGIRGLSDVDGEVDLWTGGGTHQFLTTAEALSIVSDSANDTALGTGARTVRISGLDANYEQQQEIVALNGLTPVVSVNEYLRVREVTVVTAGSNETNVGNIDISASVGTQAHVPADDGISLNSQMTIPADRVAMVKSLNIFVSRQDPPQAIVSMRGQARVNGGAWVTLFFAESDASVQSSLERAQDISRKIPAMTDFRFRVQTTRPGTTVYAQALFVVKEEQ